MTDEAEASHGHGLTGEFLVLERCSLLKEKFQNKVYFVIRYGTQGVPACWKPSVGAGVRSNDILWLIHSCEVTPLSSVDNLWRLLRTYSAFFRSVVVSGS